LRDKETSESFHPSFRELIRSVQLITQQLAKTLACVSRDIPFDQASFRSQYPGQILPWLGSLMIPD